MDEEQQRFSNTLCQSVVIISIIVVIISLVYSIFWLLLISVVALILQKKNIQSLFVTIVIYLRCSCSSSSWVTMGQKFISTKLCKSFFVPSQLDVIHVLMALEKYRLARSLIEKTKDTESIWFIIKQLNYVQEIKQHPHSQSRDIFKAILKQFHYLSLGQNIIYQPILKKRVQVILNTLINDKNTKEIQSNLKDENQNINLPQETCNRINQFIRQNQQLKRKDNGQNPKKQIQYKQMKIKEDAISIYSVKYCQPKSLLKSQINSVRGLNNLGNTCYMNSAIQCLHKTIELTQAIKQKGNMGSAFIKAYLQLMDQLSQNKSNPFRPSEIKKLVSKYYPIFEGYSQQDSCELLSTILNYIHDQLNVVKDKNYYNVNKNVKTDEQLLKQYRRKDQSRSKSIIDDIFYGRFITIYQCLDCNNQQKLFEKFHVIYLPVVDKVMKLQQCMKQFCKPDQLRGNDAWFCSKCQKDTPTNKTMSIYQANKILIICLKRFTQTSKINKIIKFDQTINLKPITKNANIVDLTYDLYGVINHSGESLHYGHYYSYCKVGTIWKQFNDTSVNAISQKVLTSEDAFVLLYRLRA